jgi:hypothetical protein
MKRLRGEFLSVEFEGTDEFGRRENGNEMFSRDEMLFVARHEGVDPAGEGDFQEGRVGRIGKSERQRSGDDRKAFLFKLPKKGIDMIGREAEDRSMQNISIFSKNPLVISEPEHPRSRPTQNGSRLTERPENSRDQDIRIEDDDHVRRLLRTA